MRIDIELLELTNDQKYLNNAFNISERSKVALFRESLADLKAKSFSGIPDSILSQEYDLNIKLAYYQQAVIEEEQSSSDIDSLRLTFFASQLFKSQVEHENFNRELENSYPQYYQLKYDTDVISTKEVEKILADKDEVLVEYFLGENTLSTFVITGDTTVFIYQHIDSTLSDRVSSFVNAIENSDLLAFRLSGYNLYNLLILPIERFVAKKDLIIIPDGLLNSIPFEALLTKPNSTDDFYSLPYLAYNHAIRYALSATLLKKETKPVRVSNSLLAFAPVFTGRSQSKWRSLFAPIPFTKKEVQEAGIVFQKAHHDADVYFYEEASEAKLKSLNLQGYSHIHFATHGIINEEKPELSHLLLERDTSSVEDGKLFTGEIYNLLLNARLVTLSACETAMGQLIEGEGLLGLTRSFFYAGADQVLATLWKIDDKTASTAMPLFYSYLMDDHTTTQALHLTKLDLINNRATAEPKFWAPYILTSTTIP